MFYNQKAFINYLSIIVTLFIIINIKCTIQLTNSVNNNNNEIVNNNFNLFENNVTCDIPNESDKGTCLLTSKCNAYIKIKKFPYEITPERVNFLKSIQCITKNNYDDNLENLYEPRICCPKNRDYYKSPELKFSSTLLSSSSSSSIVMYNGPKKISSKKQKRRIQKVQNSGTMSGILNNECGKQITNRIFGGEIAELDEFPWMALFVYNTNELGCSGALINKRYILTAAHCVKGHIVREKKGLKYVRLGEFNIQTQPDCIEEKNYLNCADISLDVPIEKIFVHPNYDEFSKDKIDDIALVKLRNTVSFTHFIMPICLPEMNASKSLQPGQYLSVSGWGRTDLFNKYTGNIKSPIKLKLKVPIVSRNNCTEILNAYGVQLGTKQICAGGELSKDTCAGDSGGPLMYFDRMYSHWVTYGIVSYGFTECGMSGHPAVYTDVSQYIDWILKTIKN